MMRAIPPWMIFVAEKLTPHYHRDVIIGDLWPLRDEGRRKWTCRMSREIAGIIRSQMRDAFSFWLLFGEAAFVCLPIFILQPQSPVFPSIVMLALLLSMLRLRDAYAYPAQGTISEMVLDAGYALGVVISFEAGFQFVKPELALPASTVLIAGIGAVGVSTWRMVFRQEDPPDPVRRRFKEQRIAIWHLNVLFAVAALLILFTSVGSVPGSDVRSAVLVFLPMALMTVALRQGKADWKGVNYEPPIRLFRDPQLDGWQHQRSILPVPEAAGLPRAFIEILFFVVIAFPCFQAVWQEVTNQPSAASIDWLQVEVNSVAVLILAALWTPIRKWNRQLADAMDQQISQRTKATGL